MNRHYYLPMAPAITRMHKTTVRIRNDQAAWARDNERFNLSGFVRQKLDEEMEDDDAN